MKCKARGPGLLFPPDGDYSTDWVRIFQQRVRRELREITNRIGVPYYSPKSIRSKSLTDISKKFGPEVVRDIDGHTTYGTTHEYYVKALEGEKRDAIFSLG